MSELGHNSVNGDHLRAFVERVEGLESEKRETAELIKEVYAEARSTGFDAKTIRTIVAMRRKEKTKRDEEEAILALYLSALGM